VIGQVLNHYRIVEALGAGGMGEVFVAHDTKLDRKVALKVLPALLSTDADRRERFTREARAVAALSHPNIVTLYSVEESTGTHFLTMELVEGRTLADLIPAKGFALDQLLKLAIPLADAVSAAHERGITHRDLKPANIMSPTARRRPGSPIIGVSSMRRTDGCSWSIPSRRSRARFSPAPARRWAIHRSRRTTASSISRTPPRARTSGC
jgi:aminoglycoside phosphotransferase (APT) family kinase protein